MEQPALCDQPLRWRLDVQHARAGGHPLGVSVGDRATTAVAVLVVHHTVEHVGDGLEPAMRMPRGALGLTRCVLHLAHLVEVHERVEGREVHTGEGATYREPLSFVAFRRGRDRGDRPDRVSEARSGQARKDGEVVDGDSWHGGSSGRGFTALNGS